MTGIASPRPDDDLRPLPHYLRPGLRVVFIGYNPGIESARQGHYYAFRGNVFWRHLSASGIVSREVTHLDDAILFAEEGIGFTDLCSRPTARASHLENHELVTGAANLHRDLIEYQPGVAVFSSLGVFREFGRHAMRLSARELSRIACGLQGHRIGETALFVVPSSSGLASKWHARRLALLQELPALLRDGRGVRE